MMKSQYLKNKWQKSSATMNKNKINLLDCTLRDGGYYNNWFFDKELINEYLKVMDLIKIDYVEIGFRFLDKIKIKETNYKDVIFKRNLKFLNINYFYSNKKKILIYSF